MRALRLHDTNIITENAFNQDNLGTKGNDKCDSEEKTLFWRLASRP